MRADTHVYTDKAPDPELEEFTKLYNSWVSSKDVYDYAVTNNLLKAFKDAKAFFSFFVRKECTEVSKAFFEATKNKMHEILTSDDQYFRISAYFNPREVNLESEYYNQHALGHIFFFWGLHKNKFQSLASEENYLSFFFRACFSYNEPFFQRFSDFFPAPEFVAMMQEHNLSFSVHTLCHYYFWGVSHFSSDRVAIVQPALQFYDTYFKPSMTHFDITDKNCRVMLNTLAGCHVSTADPGVVVGRKSACAAFDELQLSAPAVDIVRQYREDLLAYFDPNNYRVTENKFCSSAQSQAVVAQSQAVTAYNVRAQSAKIKDPFSGFEKYTLELIFGELPELLVPYAIFKKDLKIIANTMMLKRIDYEIAYGIILELAKSAVNNCNSVWGTVRFAFSGEKKDDTYIADIKKILSDKGSVSNKELCDRLSVLLDRLGQDSLVSVLLKEKLIEHCLLKKNVDPKWCQENGGGCKVMVFI